MKDLLARIKDVDYPSLLIHLDDVVPLFEDEALDVEVAYFVHRQISEAFPLFPGALVHRQFCDVWPSLEECRISGSDVRCRWIELGGFYGELADRAPYTHTAKMYTLLYQWCTYEMVRNVSHLVNSQTSQNLQVSPIERATSPSIIHSLRLFFTKYFTIFCEKKPYFSKKSINPDWTKSLAISESAFAEKHDIEKSC